MSNPGQHERLTVDPGREWRRQLLDRAFRVAGFLATFFGLAVLVLFLSALIYSAVEWFTVVPQMVEDRNQVLRAEEEAGEKKLIAKKNKDIDRQLQRKLDAAKTEKEKEKYRKTYARIRKRELEQAKLTWKERAKAIESDMRPDTSGAGVVGHFLTHPNSGEPQNAGILPALLGSIWLAVITILFAVPLGVGAAVYLEEYGRKNALAQIIQVNINNLAGVPSVVFGILGAFVFIEVIFKPLHNRYHWIEARNLLAGGRTLALLTLPVVIVASQEALRAIPSSIRHGAYALGATQWQVTRSLVLPCALPGILTGTILSLSRAIGEAAPLVLIGAVLYTPQNPSLFSSFTAVPMQIYFWAAQPTYQHYGDVWQYNAAMGSIILLITLLAMNAGAIYLRQRGQKHMKW